MGNTFSFSPITLIHFLTKLLNVSLQTLGLLIFYLFALGNVSWAAPTCGANDLVADMSVFDDQNISLIEPYGNNPGTGTYTDTHPITQGLDGYVFQDTNYGNTYYRISEWTGDRTSNIGGSIKFGIAVSDLGTLYGYSFFTGDDDIRLTGNGQTLTYDFNNGSLFDSTPAPSEYNEVFNFDVPLTAAAFGVTDAVFTAVMDNLQYVEIRAEFWTGISDVESALVPAGSSFSGGSPSACNTVSLDYGDAPAAYGDASHEIPTTPTTYLGSTVPDSEANTQNTANGGTDGTGDGADEDGVSSFPTLTTGTSGNYDVSVVCNGDGANVYGWLDFNDNDSFADSGEFANTTCSDSGAGDGSATLSFGGYTMASAAGTTYARIRITTDSLTSANSATSASDGEVEDYSIAIEVNSCPSSLDFQNPVLESGTNNQTGAIYRFSNVGTNVDALVEILAISDATIGNFDDTSTGALESFQPELMQDNATPGAAVPDQHVDFEIRFVTSGTSNPVTLATVEATAVDIDGDDAGTREYTILYNADSYTFENPTNLTSPSIGRFTPLTTANTSGISLTNTEAMVTAYFSNVSSIRYTTGFTNDGTDYTSYHRLSSLSFDCITYNNPDTPAISQDYGDAPDAYGDASHIVLSTPATYLGSTVPDSEANTQNTANGGTDGTGDGADEDGVSSFPELNTATSGNYDVSVSCNGNGANVYGWVDFNDNDSFGDTGEFASSTCSDTGSGDGSATLSFSGYSMAGSATTTYARIRITTDTLTTTNSATSASDGEIEDYAITVAADLSNFSCTSKVDIWFANDESGSVSATEFIDARDFIYLVSDEFYHSFADGAQGGLVGWAYSAAPKNVIMPLTETFYDPGDTGLASTGTTLDGDGNGVRENYTAKVDTTGGTHLSNATQGVADLVNAGNGRRTGVPQVAVFLTDAPFSQINNVSGNGGGTAWEAAAANLRNAGPDGVRIAVVLLAEAADAYDNNAASRATIDSVIGNDGIVIKTSSYALAADPAESYIQQTVDKICGITSFTEYDYGDAPVSGSSPNGTNTNNYGETSHIISSGVYLGTSDPDGDTANQPSVNADGDDTDGSDDEDGVVIPVLTQGESSSLVATVVGSGGYLQGWIDFDGNGTFDASEQVASNLQDGGTGDSDGSGNGTITFNVDVPMTAVTAQTYARFRWSTNQNLDELTQASDGEVEDYALTIELGGFPVKGRVFIDSNVDGINDSSEQGVSGLPVVLMKVESNPANNTCVSARTGADGNYEFFPVLPGNYQLYEASRETVPVPQNCDVSGAKDSTGYRSTTDNVLTQFSVVDAEITGKDFGDVRLPTFSPDNSGSILPGNVVFYAHTFSLQSTGTVAFASTGSGNVTDGWSNIVYQDSNCNRVLDGAEATAPVAANLNTTAGNDICLINKVYAPGNVVNGETYTNIITADFVYNDAGGTPNALAGSVSLTVTDITKAAANDPVTPGSVASRLELTKTVRNITQNTAETETQNQANPGDVLEYKIYYSNSGNGPITDLKVNDTVQEFTLLQSGTALCVDTPSTLTCSPQESDPNVEWLFTGTLEGGDSGSVRYRVQVE